MRASSGDVYYQLDVRRVGWSLSLFARKGLLQKTKCEFERT
jgi:hypothetical protein